MVLNKRFRWCKSIEDVVLEATRKYKDLACVAGAGDGDGGGDDNDGGGNKGCRRKFTCPFWVVLHVENLDEPTRTLIRRLETEIPGVDLMTIDLPSNQVIVSGPIATDPDSLVENLRTRGNLVVSIVRAPFRGFTRPSP
ncbi:hypothetical protein GUJ93_ZPchr0012g22196 [Zizania palustris]|uniref:HMA domain-containing protein n=1 Tax=Zizania palustris TaxID=103762 RepID=A0A8J6BPU8_ZIZPA|nr:hypothetical protein GUJ93_ZPchr0012g22196 [Zizania palustris]